MGEKIQTILKVYKKICIIYRAITCWQTGIINKDTFYKASICTRCSFANKFWLYNLCIKDDYFESLQGMKCDKCHCSLTLKVRSEDKCPLDRW